VCGICGKLNFEQQRNVPTSLIRKMADTLYHRGPDDGGYYVSGQLGLGFRRLSIIDVNNGHQPMCNENGSIWIVFNGEIYNYQELREVLVTQGHIFRTETDTEVIVHLYEEFGEACVDKLRGMFAFAIWDAPNRELFCARDRLGIKPFYYFLNDTSFIFGSEIKAILVDPEVQPDICPKVIDRFFTLYYNPGQETPFRNVYKLAPGSCMRVKDGSAEIKQYWDLRFDNTDQTLQDAKEELVTLLDEAVRLHMISDVPVGFLLSGGVDSTAMMSFAVGKSDHSLNSFTIGFSDPEVVDERPYARLAAARYGAAYHELTISAREFADFMPKYVWHMEEPVNEPTAIALYYVSRLAKEYVKVLISGEGGDEAFAGYPNYRNVLWLEQLKKVLGPLTGGLSSLLRLVNRAAHSDRIKKYSHMMSAPLESYYYSRISAPSTFFNSPECELYSDDFADLVDKDFSLRPIRQYLSDSVGCGVVNRMLYVDTKSALPDDLLLKADKMTMANSVELRVPLLDHKLLEFAARLPESFKVRGFTTKFIAKSALRDRVPREILQRKKVGFPVPFGSWFKNELRGFISDVLLDRQTLSRGYFKKAAIEGIVAENRRSGQFSKEILSLLSLELWHRAFFVSNRMDTSLPTLSVAGLSERA